MLWKRLLIAELVISLGILGFGGGSLVFGGVYRDKNGKIYIGDTPPAGGEYTAVSPSSQTGGFARPATKTPAAWHWEPLKLAIDKDLDRTPKEPNTLFTNVNQAVWTVLAAPSPQALEKREKVTLGSAVAVGQDKLLTNCHVVQGQAHIVVKRAQTHLQTYVMVGDAQSDRCVLLLSGQTLQAVSGYRSFASLAVGEEVFAIGSPRGLENTFSKGIISGLRETRGRRFVQTTAALSPGSSGGGLFDQAGNLIGITTFKVNDSEGLNFAIAVEDFTQ